MSLSNYISICDAIVRLMDPLIEIVIHNVQENSVVYINGSLSGRKVGDPSLLAQEGLKGTDQAVYSKINFDGRLVKSVSVMLEEKWLLCINCDVSLFSKMRDLSQALLQNHMGAQPVPLFMNDWQEKVHASIHSYLQDHHLSFAHLTQGNKKAIVQHLFDLGAFYEKNSADYVAKVLSLGRATVFKYLKKWRDQ